MTRCALAFQGVITSSRWRVLRRHDGVEGRVRIDATGPMSNVEPVSAAAQDHPMSLTILGPTAVPRSGRIAAQLTDGPEG